MLLETVERDSLDGLTLAAAFRKHVIEDAEVAAIGRQMLGTRSSNSTVFSEGQFPGAFVNFHWPVHATAERIAWAFVSSPVMFMDGTSPTPSKLEITASELLADRIAALFGRLARGEVVAFGTFAATGVEAAIGMGQWMRTDLLIDMENSSVCEMRDHRPVAIWTGVCLRLPDQGSSNHKTAALSPPDAGPPTAARKQIQTKSKSRHECVDWLTSMMSDPAVIPLTNDELWAEASAKWPAKLSKREFDKCRALVLASLSEEQRYLWARPGPKRRSSQF